MTRSRMVFNEKMRHRAELSRQFTGEVAKQMSIRRLTQLKLADQLGVSPNTLRKRIWYPETQTIAQMRELCDLLEIPEETYRKFV